jgi:hypothetical protein
MATHLLAETSQIAGGINWDKLPSTAVSARTISAKTGLKSIRQTRRAYGRWRVSMVKRNNGDTYAKMQCGAKTRRRTACIRKPLPQDEEA